MNVSLTPHLEEYVRNKVESGLYNSSSEVVREALRLMEERDRLREIRLEELRKEIQVGIDQADRGQLTPGDEVFRQLRKRNEEFKKKVR
jgi:antitoxin ParD1/3/4